MRKDIGIYLPLGHYLLKNKKSFWNLCRLVSKPLGEKSIVIVCEKKDWINLRELFKILINLNGDKIFKIVSPFGYVFVMYE